MRQYRLHCAQFETNTHNNNTAKRKKGRMELSKSHMAKEENSTLLNCIFASSNSSQFHSHLIPECSMTLTSHRWLCISRQMETIIRKHLIYKYSNIVLCMFTATKCTFCCRSRHECCGIFCLLLLLCLFLWFELVSYSITFQTVRERNFDVNACMCLCVIHPNTFIN